MDEVKKAGATRSVGDNMPLECFFENTIMRSVLLLEEIISPESDVDGEKLLRDAIQKLQDWLNDHDEEGMKAVLMLYGQF